MKRVLIFGDLLALFLTTLLGFATHREAELSFLPRFTATYFPLSITWLLLASWFGLFQPEITSTPKQLWRIPLAMLFAASLAVLVRAVILNSAVILIFAIVLGGTSAMGILIWRALYFLTKRKS